VDATMTRFSIIPKDNAAQALRIRRYFQAVTVALMVQVFFVALYAGGYMSAPGLCWALTSTSTCFVVFYAAIRSNFNLKFRDPSLTAAQMVSAFLVMTSSGFFIDSTGRELIIPIMLMIFYFGIYRMDTRAMTKLALIGIALYGAMLVMLYVYRRDALDLNLELLRWAVLAVVALWFGTLGGHVTQLRRELAARKEAIEALLERDDLTGVGNRRFLTHMLEQERSRTDRAATPFCVAMMDLDHFKKVNDTYGHAAGDKILQVFARVAQQDLRKIDYFGRYGGEEFMLIMSDTRLDGAQATAERLRSNVENARFNDIDAKLIQTVSIGIAEFRRGDSIEQVQLRADKAMYKAKAKGRNRVEIDTSNAPDEAFTPRPTLAA